MSWLWTFVACLKYIASALTGQNWHELRRLSEKKKSPITYTVRVKCTGPSCRTNVKYAYGNKNSGEASPLTAETKRFVVKMYRFVSYRFVSPQTAYRTWPPTWSKNPRNRHVLFSSRWYSSDRNSSAHTQLTQTVPSPPTLQLTETSSVTIRVTCSLIHDNRYHQKSIVQGSYWHARSRNAYIIVVEKPEDKRPLGKSWRRWEDNITIELT
jgi:hypothetical protein